MTVQKGSLAPSLGERSLPLPQGIFSLPFEYPSNLRTDGTFHNDDGKAHKLLWDRAVMVTTPSEGMKYVQSYQVLIKQRDHISGTYTVSNGANWFTVSNDYARGRYRAYVSAKEGDRQDVTAKLTFTIY